MHIVLISACEKKSLKKTRAVLDSYAIRAGKTTWITPITRAGLVALRMMLRRHASKNTSVACYQNEGYKRMKLLWIVGNARKFGVHGTFPIASKARGKSAYPTWAKTAALLASSAGYLHDIGKFGKAFQNKLRCNHPKADPVRHEWISMFVVKQMFAGASWSAAWNAPTDGYRDMSPFTAHLKNAFEVLLFLISTHHRLPASQTRQQRAFIPLMSHSGHVNDSQHRPQPVCEPDDNMKEKMYRRLRKVAAIAEKEDLHYWRALALFSRMALILADHSVSAEDVSAEDKEHINAPAYANTDRKTKKMKQNLNWHLRTVGNVAGDMIFKMLSLAPPSLSWASMERIQQPAKGDYAWQESAARALSGAAEKHTGSHLVFNMASTGSGKTRMNIRAICELSRGKPVRVATALNLRTLTLQTGSAFVEQVGIDSDEMACVIGDRLTKALYRYHQTSKKSDFEDDDGNPWQSDVETASDFDYVDAPTWLQKFIQKKPNNRNIIGAPVLVSTIDFLIAAGEPNRQGHHVLAALRMMSSDLVLDEIDAYDPKPLLAVLRLVMLAAFFGRNVVVSSATLSTPVAKAVWRAYQRGIEMRGALYSKKQSFITIALDDKTPTSTLPSTDMVAFDRFYEKKIARIVVALQKQPCYRIPFLQTISPKSPAGFVQAIIDSISMLHNHNSLRDPLSGKKISFGLVRMANISPAVTIAKALSEQLPDAKIACYHSQHFPLLRFHIERRLDALLSRKKGDEHLFADPEIRQAIDHSEGDNLLFIVVATPVEEIGRDHDFDWAVIEPSSAQSIVQTAGRVNRHRLIPIDKPNVAILQYNGKEISGEKAVFENPGLENKKYSYTSHDIGELFNWSGLQKIDAEMRFGSHEFARLDNQNLIAATQEWLDLILGDGKNGHLWMCQDVYLHTPLRAPSPRLEITLIERDNPESMLVSSLSDNPLQRQFSIEKAIANSWLYLDDHALSALAMDASIDLTAGMTASVIGSDLNNLPKRHLSFGFYR